MEKQYVGIDLHLRRSVMVRRDDKGNTCSTVRLDNRDVGGIVDEIRAAGSEPDVIVEATYGWYWLVDLLQAEKRGSRRSSCVAPEHVASARRSYSGGAQQPGPALRPRVGPFVHADESLLGDMRVALGRPQARVAEELLDDAEVGAAVKQVGCVGVA